MVKDNEYIQFAYHALGSCVELDTEIMIATDLGYIDQSRAIEFSERLSHITRMLCKLIKESAPLQKRGGNI